MNAGVVQRICGAFLTAQDRRLIFCRLTFTQLDAQFLVDFVQEHQNAVHHVRFDCCTFEAAGAVDILKNGFSTMMPDVEVRVEVHPSQIQNGIRSLSYFPSLTEMATDLDLSYCRLGDDDLGYIVDTILNTNGKQRLKSLDVEENNLSSRSLQHTTRLVQQSKVEHLNLRDNDGLLNDRAQMQSFCDDGLKKNKHLKRIAVRVASDNEANATTDMLVDALTDNTSLTEVYLSHQDMGDEAREVIRRRLVPLLIRNRQMSKVQSLLDRALGYPFPTPDHFLDAMVWENPNFLDSPDLSALYLALRNVTVGRQGEGAELLVLPLASARVEQERRRQREQLLLQQQRSVDTE